MHARMVLGVGKGGMFREVSSYKGIHTQNLVAQYKPVSLSLSDLPILISSLDSLHILLLLLVIDVCIGEDHLGKVPLRYPPFLRVKPVKLGVCGECIM